MKLNVYTTRYVSASDLFKGLGALWDAFDSYVSDCSYGDNNQTLIDPQRIVNALDGNCDTEELEGQFKTLLNRIDDLPDFNETGMVYVDLEN